MAVTITSELRKSPAVVICGGKSITERNKVRLANCLKAVTEVIQEDHGVAPVFLMGDNPGVEYETERWCLANNKSYSKVETAYSKLWVRRVAQAKLVSAAYDNYEAVLLKFPGNISGETMLIRARNLCMPVFTVSFTKTAPYFDLIETT